MHADQARHINMFTGVIGLFHNTFIGYFCNICNTLDNFQPKMSRSNVMERSSVLAMKSVFVLALFFDEAGIKTPSLSEETSSGFIGRKLLQSDYEGGNVNHTGMTCSTEDISIFQASTAPLPNGIPSYTVEILNSCVSGYSICNIHVKCGWFSSVRLVNPRVFRRINYDDCLVNDGQPLSPGQTLSFQYANSFQYPISVSSVACCSN